jgi:hypothetical protein
LHQIIDLRAAFDARLAVDDLSMVVPAPISTSSSIDDRPTWESLASASLHPFANPKPSQPITAFVVMMTALPMIVFSRIATPEMNFGFVADGHVVINRDVRVNAHALPSFTFFPIATCASMKISLGRACLNRLPPSDPSTVQTARVRIEAISARVKAR